MISSSARVWRVWRVRRETRLSSPSSARSSQRSATEERPRTLGGRPCYLDRHHVDALDTSAVERSAADLDAKQGTREERVPTEHSLRAASGITAGITGGDGTLGVHAKSVAIRRCAQGANTDAAAADTSTTTETSSKYHQFSPRAPLFLAVHEVHPG